MPSNYRLIVLSSVTHNFINYLDDEKSNYINLVRKQHINLISQQNKNHLLR
jgi:hypothetical protein